MTSCRGDGDYCPDRQDCPQLHVDIRPRPLRWEDRFPGVPADEASPYCGQIFAPKEATALEFVAYLFDRHLMTEWPERQQRLVSDTEFEDWFGALQSSDSGQHAPVWYEAVTVA